MSAALVVAALVVALLAIVGAWLGGVAIGRRQGVLEAALDQRELREVMRITNDHLKVTKDNLRAAEAVLREALLREPLAKAWTSFVAGLALVHACDDDDLRTPEGDHPSPSFRDGWDAALVQVRTLVDTASAGGRPEVLESVLDHLQWTRALLRGTRMEACLTADPAEGAKLASVDALLVSFGK